jgi:hypothetical protein
VTQPTLHPNLAKLAAAYDMILERLDRQQVTPIAARAEIAQLEARDDAGVRWSIDPDSGEWIRKTAFGDVEFDPRPPVSGYMTPDAFDYTQTPEVFDPTSRLSMAPVNDSLNAGPSGLSGATRRGSSRKRPSPAAVRLPRSGSESRDHLSGGPGQLERVHVQFRRAVVVATPIARRVRNQIVALPRRVQLIGAVVVALLLTLAVHSCASSPGTVPSTPVPATPVPAAPVPSLAASTAAVSPAAGLQAPAAKLPAAPVVKAPAGKAPVKR